MTRSEYLLAASLIERLVKANEVDFAWGQETEMDSFGTTGPVVTLDERELSDARDLVRSLREQAERVAW